jgi:uncharacterized protein (TIGR00290 family)
LIHIDELNSVKKHMNQSGTVRRVIVSWSGGKDCARALYELMQDKSFQVIGLLTTASRATNRVSHHATHRSLLQRQAESLCLPLDVIELPTVETETCTMDSYAEIMRNAMTRYVQNGIDAVAFGDLFLEDLRHWREERLAEVGISAIFPLWHRDTATLARSHSQLGFKAIIVSTQQELGPERIGSPYDTAFLDSLPHGIDPCGEQGEFHMFVYDAPYFQEPISFKKGNSYLLDSHYYLELS